MHRVALYLFTLAIFLRIILKTQPHLKTLKGPRRLKLIYPIENVVVASHQGHITIHSLFEVKENSSEFGEEKSVVISLSY